MEHPFIFKAGRWLGEGKITFSTGEDPLAFCTQWSVPTCDKEGRVHSLQEIQVAGLSEPMQNQFCIYDVTRSSFSIELENQSLGNIIGKGVINKTLIGWEFLLGDLGLEGFEFYERAKEPNTYWMHAEYELSDDMRTVIHGRIWQAEGK